MTKRFRAYFIWKFLYLRQRSKNWVRKRILFPKHQKAHFLSNLIPPTEKECMKCPLFYCNYCNIKCRVKRFEGKENRYLQMDSLYGTNFPKREGRICLTTWYHVNLAFILALALLCNIYYILRIHTTWLEHKHRQASWSRASVIYKKYPLSLETTWKALFLPKYRHQS